VTSLRIGSRGSALALWQAEFIRDWLVRTAGASAEIITIRTAGDHFQQGSVAQIGLKGVFIKEIEDALLDGSVDLAIHSLKDVPTEIPAGLALVAIPPREDPRDCLISRSGAGLAALPHGARVGTSSLRRQAQLRRARPDLEILELRGNVDTRLRRVAEGAMDAAVLAYAGVKRLKQEARVAEVLATELMLPAVGQGALAVEAREDNREAANLLAPLEHPDTRVAVTAERAVLAALQGGCQVPLGAWARIENGRLLLDACVCAVDGSEIVRDRAAGSAAQPEALGRALGEKLLAAGADRLLRLAGRS
jgi:hydroxymethylbilane synthase